MSNFKFIVLVMIIILFFAVLISTSVNSNSSFCEQQGGKLFKTDSGYVCEVDKTRTTG